MAEWTTLSAGNFLEFEERTKSQPRGGRGGPRGSRAGAEIQQARQYDAHKVIMHGHTPETPPGHISPFELTDAISRSGETVVNIDWNQSHD